MNQDGHELFMYVPSFIPHHSGALWYGYPHGTYIIWLVVWNIFFHMLGRIIHPNWLILFRGVGQPPTSHSGDASALLLHLMSSPVPGVLLHRGQAPRLPTAAAHGAPGVPPWALELWSLALGGVASLGTDQPLKDPVVRGADRSTWYTVYIYIY